jgi:hypothetical protein
MAQTAAEARQEVVNARKAVESELDDLGAATRAALDIPAKIKRNPVQTVGALGGVAFLLLGGPKRVAKEVESRLFPQRREKVPSILPKDVEKTVNTLEPEERDKVRAHLERDFYTYLQREHPTEPANARRSLWRTYDIVIGILGAAAARELVKKLFEIPKEVRVEQIQEEGEAVADAEAKVSAAKAARRSR